MQEYEDFFRSSFTAENLTLYIPRKIRSVQTEGSCVSVGLEALVCKKEPVVVSALMRARSFTFTGLYEPAIMSLEFVNSRVLRVRCNRGTAIIRKNQPMLAAEPVCAGIPEAEETDGSLVWRTGHFTVALQKEPFCMNIFDHAGRLLYGQYNDDRHNATADRRRGIAEAGDGGGEQAANSFPAFETFPFGCVVNDDTGETCCCDSVRIQYDEHFYGFGEQFSPLDKLGRKIPVWTVNPLGVSTAKAYKPVAFFSSSRGYGVYVNSPRKIRFKMSDYFFKAYSMEIEDDLLDIFIITGGIKTILDEYTSLTGKPRLPPKWAFGIWMSRNCYRSRDELLEVARRLRKLELPCDVLHIDWDYCKSYNFDFEFDENRFQNPREMIGLLETWGFKTSIWQLPYIKFDSPVFREAAEQGFLALQEDGEIADTQAGEGVIDFSNPRARSWYQKKLTALLSLGIRVIKTDFGENAQESYRYLNIDGRDMHNLYPLLYNQAAYQAIDETLHGDGLVWGRSACAGCQRFPVFWGGDSDSDYDGLYHSLRGGLSIGLSGFPLWSHDVGGYYSVPERDVYIRWMQAGMFSPLVRFHGTSSREPWNYGDEAVAIYRKYAGLRYSLIEYIYNEARLSTLNSLPLMRALALEFEGDPAVCAIDDQYMFGENLLVAPALSAGRERKIYLPEGSSWLDFHSREITAGGRWIIRETPLDIIPLYFKSDTLTIFAPQVQHTGEEREKTLTLLSCCGGKNCGYVMHSGWLNGSVEFMYPDGGEKLHIGVTGFEGFTFKFELYGLAAQEIRFNGEPVRPEQGVKAEIFFWRSV
jgi:alpha-D-xyloside xylohydrolase